MHYALSSRIRLANARGVHQDGLDVKRGEGRDERGCRERIRQLVA
jgi:hypothetical protein